jgi:hypothetical protein
MTLYDEIDSLRKELFRCSRQNFRDAYNGSRETLAVAREQQRVRKILSKILSKHKPA